MWRSAVCRFGSYCTVLRVTKLHLPTRGTVMWVVLRTAVLCVHCHKKHANRYGAWLLTHDPTPVLSRTVLCLMSTENALQRVFCNWVVCTRLQSSVQVPHKHLKPSDSASYVNQVYSTPAWLRWAEPKATCCAVGSCYLPWMCGSWGKPVRSCPPPTTVKGKRTSGFIEIRILS